MGINYSYSNEPEEYEKPVIIENKIDNNIKAPKFYLNKEFPNYYNLSMEEVLQSLLKCNYDLLENQEITSSISKQFKLLYLKNSGNISGNINILEEKKEASKENDKSDLKLSLNNDSNINNDCSKEPKKKKLYSSDYNIYSSLKNNSISSKINISNNNIINYNNQSNNDINKNMNKSKEKFDIMIKETFSNYSKSSKSFTRDSKPHVKIRKFTEVDSAITEAASLLKDIRKEYRFKNQLGGGHFGTVRKAYRISDKSDKNNKNMQYYAIKSIPMKNLSCNIDDFIKEVDIISSLDHPNIIKFYETYHDDCFFHIVMELCKGKEVMSQMGHYGFIEEKKVANIIFKVLLAIAHCHNRGVTHRDLKPENILFDSMKKDAEIKIIDFGLSRKYDKEQKMHSILGTPYYVAPEVLKGEYDEKCDIWSIGAMTYLLLCGEPPFNGNSNNEIFKKIVKESIKFNSFMWKNISNNAKDFVKLCLNKNSNNRPSASSALMHVWFSSVVKEKHNFTNIDKNILINVKNFNINQQFMQLVLKYLINHTLSSDKKDIFKSTFYALDFNHNGFIMQDDLKKAFEILKIDVDDKHINHLFDILPNNKNLGLGFCEFIMAGIDKKSIFNEDNLIKAFNYFDINNTGFIEFDNLNSALLRMGKRYINKNDINSIINEVAHNIKKNKNKNEKYYKISKDDFMEIFKYYI